MSQAPPPPPPSSPPPASEPSWPGPGGGAYPLTVEFDGGLEVDRWRVIGNLILGIPQYIIAYALRIIDFALFIVSFFMILFTKQVPEQVVNVRVMILRYELRVYTYALFLRNDYPPFSFETITQDDGIDPAKLSFQPPAELNQWLPLVKFWLLAIPHYIVLFFIEIAAFFVWIIAFFAVLFTGVYPQGLRDFMVGALRWYLRVAAYAFLLTDEYPPFSLQ